MVARISSTLCPEGKSTVQTFKPLLRLRISDLSVLGAAQLLSAIDVYEVLSNAVSAVLQTLYSDSSGEWLRTRSITLVLRPMDGVAYTTAVELDDDHKEIHFSTKYIETITPKRRYEEIIGVITHEVVHTMQFNGRGAAPSGLIEGIADFVRLKSGYVPPHWKREVHEDSRWDQGYEHTAYFLEYLDESRPNSVMAINETLRTSVYHEDTFWHNLFGMNVNGLFREYAESLEINL